MQGEAALQYTLVLEIVLRISAAWLNVVLAIVSRLYGVLLSKLRPVLAPLPMTPCASPIGIPSHDIQISAHLTAATWILHI